MPQPVTVKKLKWFYEDLQDLLELTPKKDVLFIIGDWNVKVGSQETPGVTGELGLGVQNEAGQRLIEFCQENALVITNTLFQQHKRRLYTWTSPDANTKIRLIIFFACASSAYKLNKQAGNIQPWCTPFPIWKQSIIPCPVLTVAF